jgi:putative ABC transport system permease protein
VSALSKVVRAGVGRRRVQTVVMILTTTMAVTASVLAAGLLVATQASFDQSFDGQRGAHVTARFDSGKATIAQIAATAHVSGVTAGAGPYPVLSLQPHVGPNRSAMPVGDQLPPMTIVGRATTGGPVDDLRITDGRWVSKPGEVVLTATNAPFAVGDKMTFPDRPGKPTLTVVGLARSASGSAEAWVSPTQLTRLSTPESYQMLYRFRDAATDAEIVADRAAISAALPPGAMTEAASYLKIKLSADKTSATFAPFVASFGVLGLCMSILIIGIVVAGAVSSATRRIGILKSLGFTPHQVVRAYVAQALIPASIGTALGVVFGNLLAIPVSATQAAPWVPGPRRLPRGSTAPSPPSPSARWWPRRSCPRCGRGGCGPSRPSPWATPHARAAAAWSGACWVGCHYPAR